MRDEFFTTSYFARDSQQGTYEFDENANRCEFESTNT